MDLNNLKKVLLERLPDSQLHPLSSAELKQLRKRFPDLPQHLADFFQVIGCGRIGKSRYQIYDLLSPADIYDVETAAELAGIVLVGDDFSGNCEAYDTGNDWQFGSIGSRGKFERHSRYRDFVSFIEAWYARD